MSDLLDRFYNWLEDQEYWVRRDIVDEKFPELEWRKSAGITMKEDDDGNTLVPKRDLRSLAKKPDTEMKDAEGGS